MILLDLDNVLADFETVYRGLINDITNRNATREEITDYSFAKALGLSPEENALVWRTFNEREMWRDLEPFPYARELVERLKRFAALAVVSNRPEAVFDLTREWLERNGIEVDEVYVTESPSKREYLRGKGKRPVLVIEDAPVHAREFSEERIPVILLDAPWNRFCRSEWIYRVRDLEEAAFLAERILSLVPARAGGL
ncbi:MAG: hypothetical protein D6679_01730 [Candidatus Hydrogenedentota bacterium]|nr:MAG: hypothetical protein D6679_01730 [Candidatus Hydrogenedentota bacterium]